MAIGDPTGRVTGPVAHVIELYLTIGYQVPINDSDFSVAVDIVDGLARAQLAPQGRFEQIQSDPEEEKEEKEVVKEAPKSSSRINSLLTMANRYWRKHPSSESDVSTLQGFDIPLENAASKYGRSASELLKMGFPFASVSAEVSNEWVRNGLQREGSQCFSSVIKTMLLDNYIDNGLLPETPAWEKLEKLVNTVCSRVVGKLLSDYCDAKLPQEPLHDFLFHVLLKMTIWKELPLPKPIESEKVNLREVLDNYLKIFDYSKHPNPTRLIEIVLVASPDILLTTPLFGAFVLQMLVMISFIDWPKKEEVIITFLERCSEQLAEIATSFTYSTADERTKNIGQILITLLETSDLNEKKGCFNRLMEGLPSIYDSPIRKTLDGEEV